MKYLLLGLLCVLLITGIIFSIMYIPQESEPILKVLIWSVIPEKAYYFTVDDAGLFTASKGESKTASLYEKKIMTENCEEEIRTLSQEQHQRILGLADAVYEKDANDYRTLHRQWHVSILYKGNFSGNFYTEQADSVKALLDELSSLSPFKVDPLGWVLPWEESLKEEE